jgi:hypothetical protein
MPTRTVTLDQFIKEVGQLPDTLGEAVERGLRSAAARGVSVVVGEIEAVKAVNTGALKQSVNYKPIKGGGEINVDAPHAGFVEYGRRPGKFPPPGPIYEWVIRKGLASDETQAKQITFAIQREIATFGIKPRRYFARAMKKIVKDVLPTEVKREVEKI